jgi:hypothetical protein
LWLAAKVKAKRIKERKKNATNKRLAVSESLP